MSDSRRPQGIDELNLAEFPISLLTTRCPKDQDKIESSDTIFDRSTNEPVERKVTVFAAPKYGLPTPQDMDVLVSLIQHTKEVNGFTSRRVEFSRYRIIELVGLPQDGKSYKRLEDSLHRWAQVSIHYEKAWRDKSRAKWTTITAHIIDRVEINRMAGRRPNDPDEDLMSWFTWGQDVFDSIRAGNTKALDLDFYFSLDSAYAKRMYRYLDKKFHQSRELKIDLHKLAFDKIGMSRTYTDAAQIKRKLKDGIEELMDRGYLEFFPEEEWYETVTRGQYNVCLVRKCARPIHAEPEVPVEPVRQKTEESPIVKKMIEMGIEAKIAIALATNHPVEEIEEYIDFMDWKTQHHSKSIEDPPAWLIQALRQKFPISPEYNKQKRVKEEAAARTSQAEKEAAEKRRKIAQQNHEADQIKEFLAGKSEEEVDKLFEEGMVEANDELKKTIDNVGPRNPVYKMMRRTILEGRVRTILGLTKVTAG